jgi:hypothetical protein
MTFLSLLKILLSLLRLLRARNRGFAEARTSGLVHLCLALAFNFGSSDGSDIDSTVLSATSAFRW